MDAKTNSSMLKGSLINMN